MHSTDTTDLYNTGARTRFAAPGLPQGTLDGAAQYFWVGEYLADTSFIQAGFVVNYHGCGQRCISYFVWAFDPMGNVVLAWPPNGGVFGTYATHTYAVKRGVNFGPAWEWYGTFDGTRYQNSTFYPPDADSGDNWPIVVSELSTVGTALPSTADWMGPVTYNPASQTTFGDGGAWYDTYHAAAYVWTSIPGTNCPPYNTISASYQSVRAGNFEGYTCTLNQTSFW